MTKDIAFEMAVSSVRFGVGVTREVGMDLAEMGARLVLVVTDPVLARLPPVHTVLESLEANRIPYAVYDRVRVEPSDESFLDAIAFAKERPFDAFVAVGGGSVIDTAKAVNLYTSCPPADFLDYVNPHREGCEWVVKPRRVRRRQEPKRDDGLKIRPQVAREDRHRESTAEADTRLSIKTRTC
jgi:alcohol dehydrogenase class IV